MALFDWLFGNDEKDEKQNTSFENQNDTTVGKEEAVSSSTKTGTTAGQQQQGTQTQTGTALSGKNQAVLDDLIAKSAVKSNVYGDPTKQALQDQLALGSTVSTLMPKPNSGLDLDKIVKSAQDSAQLSFDEGQGAQISQFADATGSKLNSTVQLLQQKGQRDLATQKAAIEGDIRLKGADTQNQSIKTISDVLNQITGASAGIDMGGSQSLQDSLNALNVAKGSQTTQGTSTALSGTSTSDTTENKISQTLMQQIIQELSKGTGANAGSGSVATGGNLIPLLDIITRF